MLELRGWKPHRRLSYSYNTTDLRMDDPPYIGYFDLFRKSVKAGMPKLIGRLVGNLTQLQGACKPRAIRQFEHRVHRMAFSREIDRDILTWSAKTPPYI